MYILVNKLAINRIKNSIKPYIFQIYLSIRGIIIYPLSEKTYLRLVYLKVTFKRHTIKLTKTRRFYQ